MQLSAGRGSFAVLDGGLSTALEELGERPSGMLWTAQVLLERPQVVTAAHAASVHAGADVVITSSYQASEEGFVAAGVDRSTARSLLASTTEVARRSGAAIVACSIGPYGAVRADGSEYHGRYDADWATVREFHRRRLEVLVDTGPDVFAVETIPSIAEAVIVMEELRSLTNQPAWVSFTCRDGASTCSGDSFADAARAVADAATWVGVNCTAPHFVDSLLASADAANGFVVYPNHGGEWDADAKRWVGPTDAPTLAERASVWAASGAVAIGGCCGVGTADISALAARRG